MSNSAKNTVDATDIGSGFHMKRTHMLTTLQ
jgi:hypothetical protein